MSIITNLAAILTVSGVSIYVLGLIALAIPIRRVFTGDLSTAWYAVSLVPKTVVAGQGARIWLRWTIVFAVPLLLIALLLQLVSESNTRIVASLCGGLFWVVSTIAFLWFVRKGSAN